jgi:antirestriction protein ArdC
MTDRADVYQRVTDRIIADLENGVRTWMKPWSGGEGLGAPLRHNGIPYKGINVLMLWSASMTKGYTSPFWLTYKQAQALGGHVRRGESGETVVFASKIAREATDAQGEAVEKLIPFMKGYTVFNASQCDDLPAQFYPASASMAPLDPAARLAAVDQFVAKLGVDLRHGGHRAFYAQEPDYVQLPVFESFRDAGAYAATLMHETVHWTKHPSRLDRDMGRTRWGDEGYAKEELVAEIGAAFLCAALGLVPEITNHAAYIGTWLDVLKKDKRFIFSAASHAQKAVDYLLAKGGLLADEADEEMQQAA